MQPAPTAAPGKGNILEAAQPGVSNDCTQDGGEVAQHSPYMVNDRGGVFTEE